MSGQKHLPARTSLHPMQHLWHLLDDGRMQGNLRLFQEERTSCLNHRPKEPHETKGSVGKISLRLPRSLRSPVLVFSSKVRDAADVSPHFQFPELGNRQDQGLSYAA